MHFEVDVGGRVRQVAATQSGDGFAVTVDGHPFYVDVVRVDMYTLSLLVDRVHSHEVVITADAPSWAGSQLTVRVGGGTPIVVNLNGRRHGGRRQSPPAGPGPQRIVAPMPGKIVRVPV